MADPIKNFFSSTLVGTYSDTDTSLTIANGSGAKLPDPSVDGAFNLVIYNESEIGVVTTFDGGSIDTREDLGGTNPEIVRVTAKSGDVLTVTRGQEGTTASAKEAGNTYRVILSATKKVFDDINDAIENVDLTTLTGVEELTFGTTGDEEFGLPAGTTAQRPASPSAGYLRFNTDTGELEVYSGSAWLGVSIFDGAVVINESGGDNDFRVEGQTETNLLFTDASTDRVGISTSSPSKTLEVNGEIDAGSIISDSSDTGSVTTKNTRTVIASSNSTASGDKSAVIASTDSQASDLRSAVVASQDSTADGFRTAIIGSFSSTATASRGAIIASDNSTISGLRNAVIASDDGSVTSDLSAVVASLESKASGAGNAVIGGRRTENDTNYSLALGDASSGGASTANRTIHLFGQTGNVSIAGTLTQSASFTDFAEMMPNGTGEEIPAGTILTMKDGQVLPSNDEEICGVVSHTGAILAGDTPFCWQGRYLTDEFGRRIWETIPDPDWQAEILNPDYVEEYDDEGNLIEPEMIPNPEPRGDVEVLKENPEWNPDLEQVKRSDRPDEWTPVGLVGQVFVRTAENVQAGDRLKSVNGHGVKSDERTGLKVMKVTKEYDGEYGIAKCLLNVMV